VTIIRRADRARGGRLRNLAAVSSRQALGAAVLVAAALTSCSSATSGAPPVAPSRTSSSRSPSPTPPTTPRTTPRTTPTSTSPTPTHTTPASKPPPKPATIALPRGGRQILGHYRVVAYYGGPDGPLLGVLGSESPDDIAGAIEDRAKQWAHRGLPVQPAMELIATVAQGGPGPDGDYSAPIDDEKVERYLQVAHRNKMLLILDFQPGRGDFLPQVEHFAKFLTDPAVSVALDPEWKMSGSEVPGKVIGSSPASGIVAVRDYLSGLVAAKHLPDKLLMVHQFTLAMLPDRQNITPAKGIEIVFHADGFGTQAAKNNTWNALHFPGRPYGTGFKLFLRQDTDMMGPDQVLARSPEPDVITYQ
jgi:hypothetical protein